MPPVIGDHPLTSNPNEIFSEVVCPAEPASASERDWEKTRWEIFTMANTETNRGHCQKHGTRKMRTAAT